MTEARAASASVEVRADPSTAFTAFTEEMDAWWVRSPVSFFDAARAVAMRCEGRVGGRILEVYDVATGDALEIGRITVWEPGSRLVYRSSVDDTEVEVCFEATEGGTTVRVRQSLVPGGERSVGFFWPKVVRDWFPDWVERRDTSGREPRELSRLGVALYYADPVAAAHWLAEVFRLRPVDRLPEQREDHQWIEFRVGHGAVLIFPLEGEPAGGEAVTHTVWVHVDDLDDHFVHAEANGAGIVSGIHQHGYRAYVAEDLEGHRWTFAQARPTMV